MSKLSKFFIICAAVCVLGIIMTFAGVAAGGVDDMGKVAEHHEWLHVGPESTETNVVTVGEFKSIEAEGSLDIAVISPELSAEDDNYPDFLEDIYMEGIAGTVAINWGKGLQMPEVTNEKGVLKIKGSTEEIESVDVNLNGTDPSPDVVVFCPAEQLDSISITDKYGDVAIEGVKAKKITVSTDSGDVNISYVGGEELTVDADSGDIELEEVDISKQAVKVKSGDIEIKNAKGELKAEADSGDIDFDSNLSEKEYEISMEADSGDLQYNEDELETKSFRIGSGPNKMMFKTVVGDIKVEFNED